METNLPNTFAVFILSHGRANNVKTWKTLKSCGYTGRLYIVVDNEDEQIQLYRDNFGSSSVVVFDKMKVAHECDEGNNFDNRNVILMARNACFDIAERLGVTHFVQLDDDYYYFGFRTVERARKITNIDKVFLAMLIFYKAAPVTSIAFSQGGDHIGGFAGIRLKRKCMNSFLCSTDRRFKFVGSLNEDVNTYVTLGSRGNLFFTFTGLQLDQADTQSQAGGITKAYLSLGTYNKSFTSVMMAPSCVSVRMMTSKHKRLHHSIEWLNAVPAIVSSMWSKDLVEDRGAA